MKVAINWFFKLLEFTVVALMIAMVFMVFGNVVLRYGFNSGITVSVEVSRYCFIWLTFAGAIVAMRSGAHLGVDSLIRRLPRGGKVFCFAASQLLMLMCNVLFFWGTYKMHDIYRTNVSPVVGISMIWVYGVGYVASLVIGVMNVHKLYLLATGRLTDEQLIQVLESEESVLEEDVEEAAPFATPGGRS